VRQITLCLIGTLVFTVASLGQTSLSSPTDHGMYVEAFGHRTKIIGQIAEFKRSGSLLVSDMTAGIKTRKQNIQLLGSNAQTVVSAQPVFYFIPAKQEQEAGVNAGDLILIRLEEKPKRRQFEIAARGAWRSSSGITLTHQVQLLREEVNPDVYKIMPATELAKGEYALFLARGEGMAPYVYDFSVQPVHASAARGDRNASTWNVAQIPATDENVKRNVPPTTPGVSAHASLGAFSDGNPDVRHDGVTITALTAGGPADQAGIKAGDVILAINDHYLFTIGELREEISHHQPGMKIRVRYRRYSTIYDVALVVGSVE